MLGALIRWGLVLFAVAWVIRNPTAAGATVHHWINSALAFASSLAGG